MPSYALYIYFLIYIFPNIPITATAATTPAYTAADFILLNCGESSTSKDIFGRSWDGDERSNYAPSNAVAISSGARASASHMQPSVYEVPYETTRVFHSPFTYTFPVVTGPKFLRLYFYPNIYSHFNTSQSFFSVTANDFTLFTNFSAFLQSQYSKQPSFMKEFVINIQENQRVLILTFSPNPNSSAFINGIEIVSMPDTLYFRGNDVPIKFVDQLYYLRNSTALESLYRLNVGGPFVEIQEDSGPKRGMFRFWSRDDDYMLDDNYMLYDVYYGYTPHRENVQINYTAETPPYSAPPIVYTTARVIGNYSASLDWAFPVDSGFHYLLRLHFCEIMLDVSAQNPREFTVSIYYKMPEYGADDMYLTGRPDTPIFRDYIAWIPDVGGRGKQDLRLSLFPSHDLTPPYYKALLNGLEIFKLSDSNRSLAAANPVLTKGSSHPAVSGIQGRKNHKTSVSSALYASLGSAIGLLAVVAAVSFLILRWRSKVEDTTKTSWAPLSTSTTTPSGSSFSISSHLCSYFTIDEIKSATRNFDSNSIIGKGGFGNVYKGLVNRGATTVAIKRLHPSSNQGAREFLTEIEMLSKLRHLHLVSLTGYCDDGDEMILVYDYMAHGTLRDHLYNSDNPPLKWEQRLQICLGAAKGLYFLHNGAQHAIIHRDVKSTNILLDEAWVAKISDFGLSKMGQANDSFTHISTNVKGTFGYLDPKYMSSHQLTRKSDVYAFGVVLFEVLSGRAAVDITLDEEQHSLASWARYCIRKAEVDRLIDPNLMGQISPACFKVYVGIAGRCVHIQPLERPTMADVVMGLELALTLQQTIDSTQQKEDDANDQSNEVISMDGITATIEYSPSSSIRNSQSEG